MGRYQRGGQPCLPLFLRSAGGDGPAAGTRRQERRGARLDIAGNSGTIQRWDTHHNTKVIAQLQDRTAIYKPFNFLEGPKEEGSC